MITTTDQSEKKKKKKGQTINKLHTQTKYQKTPNKSARGKLGLALMATLSTYLRVVYMRRTHYRSHILVQIFREKKKEIFSEYDVCKSRCGRDQNVSDLEIFIFTKRRKKKKEKSSHACIQRAYKVYVSLYIKTSRLRARVV